GLPRRRSRHRYVAGEGLLGRQGLPRPGPRSDPAGARRAGPRRRRLRHLGLDLLVRQGRWLRTCGLSGRGDRRLRLLPRRLRGRYLQGDDHAGDEREPVLTRWLTAVALASVLSSPIPPPVTAAGSPSAGFFR